MKKIFLVILTMFCKFSPASPQVVLTEIMFNPAGSESDDEFIEIVNLSESESVDLTGWQISDSTGFDKIIAVDEGLVLDPGQFGIILDPSYFENSNTYDDLIPENSLILTLDNTTFGDRGLSNSTPETVSLINAAGDTVSRYTYSLGNAMGFSDEKIDLVGPNTPENWADSKVLNGSPGAPNSVSPLNYNLAILPGDLKFTPETARAGDSVSLTAVVRNLGRLPAENFEIRFFEDQDSDSLLEVGEELGEGCRFEQPLLADDSVTCEMVYENIAAGLHLIFAKIDFAFDQDITDNLAVMGLLIGYPPRAVVINEIMYSPLSNQAEWVEVVNLSSETVNLQGWSLSDSDTASRSVLEDKLALPSNSYFVLAQNVSLLDIFDVPDESFAVLKNWPTLNNDSDTVVLYELTGAQMDRVDYRSSWGGGNGIALEKINPHFASNDSLNWSSSVVLEGGTPGKRNSIFAESLPPETTLQIAPNPFSPDEDGRDDFAIISYQLPLNTAVVNLKIYDLRGRLIRFLANNQPSGSQSSMVWNGRDDNGQRARMGIYIVFLQALNAQSGQLKTEKETVVLAEKL